MSNPKHVQLKPEDAAKIVEVLADVETTARDISKNKVCLCS